MGNAIGLTTAIMTAVETTYGTPVTPDRALEFDSESLERKNEILQSNSLRSGVPNLRRGSRRVSAARWGEGQITFEAVTNGLGRILQAALGGTSTVVQQGGTTAWLQTHQLGSVLGKSLTIQKQLRDEANTVVSPFTFHGCKLPRVEFKIDKKGKLMITVNVDAEDVDTTTASASPSYPAAKTFHYQQGALTMDAVALATVQDASIVFDRKMDTDRYHLGNAGRKAEPLTNDFPEVTGNLTAEFADLTLYNKFAGDLAAALVLTFTGDVISGAFNELLRITIPEVRFTGETPKVGGPGLVMNAAPFEGQYNGADAGLKVELISTDTTL